MLDEQNIHDCNEILQLSYKNKFYILIKTVKSVKTVKLYFCYNHKIIYSVKLQIYFFRKKLIKFHFYQNCECYFSSNHILKYTSNHFLLLNKNY